MANAESTALIDEILAIKKLLILQLLAMGYKQKQIAGALGVSESTLSRLLPKGFSKEVPRKSSENISNSTDT